MILMNKEDIQAQLEKLNNYACVIHVLTLIHLLNFESIPQILRILDYFVEGYHWVLMVSLYNIYMHDLWGGSMVLIITYPIMYLSYVAYLEQNDQYYLKICELISPYMYTKMSCFIHNFHMAKLLRSYFHGQSSMLYNVGLLAVDCCY